MPVIRIPYTSPLPAPIIVPAHAATSPAAALSALAEFLTAPPRPHLAISNIPAGRTLLLSGAGISVASGLADYRGDNGTYTLNKQYRPIYYNEFCERHESRQRYWARSFLGWSNLLKARPNAAHEAVGRLGKAEGGLGVVGGVVTQNVDSLHRLAHPHLSTTELHGSLAYTVCLTCRSHYPRSAFQEKLAKLNPSWAGFLKTLLESGALTTENPTERRARGLKTNPDGDVDLPGQGLDYGAFRYPACPVCLERGERGIQLDKDGGWKVGSRAGVLKPGVVMFGESIPTDVKAAAERAVDEADRILVVGSSLATYSAYRLVRRAKEKGAPVGVVNLGGVRGEEGFFDGDVEDGGQNGVRLSLRAEEVLPELVEMLEEKR